jgi:hypothetical protein
MKRILAILLVGSAALYAGDLYQPKSCDGKIITLNPEGKIMVVMASSQPLADTTREFGRAMYPWQGLDDFRVIVVVDLRKSLGTLFKGWTVGKMKADLDEEGEILQPWFRARGSKANPREVLCAIPDFDGKASESLGWGTDDRKMKVTLFGKDQKVIWSSKDVASCSEVTRRLTELLGPPAPRPPDAGPKKSKILLRRS